MSHACHRFWTCYKTLMFCSLLTRCTIPCACHAKRHFEVQKRREHVVFLTYWLRNVLRATTACTFSTSHFEMCFAPQWRALFRQLNFQKCSEREMSLAFSLANVLRATTAKWSEREVFWAFSLANVLRATTAVLRTWGAFSFFTCKCALRHNGVHFLDSSTSKSARNVRCF